MGTPSVLFKVGNGLRRIRNEGETRNKKKEDEVKENADEDKEEEWEDNEEEIEKAITFK